MYAGGGFNVVCVCGVGCGRVFIGMHGGGWMGFDSIDPMLVVHGWGLICIMGWVALYGNGRSRLLVGRSEWCFWRLMWSCCSIDGDAVVHVE